MTVSTRPFDRLARCLVPLLLAACAGATDQADAGGVEALEMQLAGTRQQLLETIGAASCTSTAQCAAVPVGAKPCGGPADHLAYSTAGTDVSRLAALAAEHRAAAQRLNTLRGLMSDCALVEPRPLACVAGSCRFVEQ
jgi:hypothetical protein